MHPSDPFYAVCQHLTALLDGKSVPHRGSVFHLASPTEPLAKRLLRESTLDTGFYYQTWKGETIKFLGTTLLETEDLILATPGPELDEDLTIRTVGEDKANAGDYVNRFQAGDGAVEMGLQDSKSLLLRD